MIVALHVYHFSFGHTTSFQCMLQPVVSVHSRAYDERIYGTNVSLGANQPLAGKVITFDIQRMGIVKNV